MADCISKAKGDTKEDDGSNDKGEHPDSSLCLDKTPTVNLPELMLLHAIMTSGKA